LSIDIRDLNALEDRLKSPFRDKAWLRLGLTHRSYLHERPEEASESNERLEFLGDAVLGMVVANILYERFPDQPEGWLTEARSRIVRTETLAHVASGLGLGDALLLGRGEEQSGGRTRQRNLARAYEAMVGAVFVDQGYVKARAFIRRTLTGQLRAVEGGPANYKSLLQESVQRGGRKAPEYTTRAAEAAGRQFQSEVVIDGAILGVGTGTSKRQAEQRAARQAYEALQLSSPRPATAVDGP
jgi:ribonuclease-3